MKDESTTPPIQISRTVIDFDLRKKEDLRVSNILNAKGGVQISSVFDLVNTKHRYLQAIPVLVEILETGVEDPLIMEGLVRALTVDEAKGIANKPLLQLFHRVPEKNWSLKWAIGNAIKKIGLPNDLEEIMTIVRDRKHGMTRQEFVSALAKFPSLEVENLLVEQLDDDDVAGNALESLRKSKSRLGHAKAQKLLNHPKAVISKEARKYIKQIEKLQ